MIQKLFLLLLLMSTAGVVKLAAQQKEYVFKNFTQEEGLPSNETYYVFEDSRHYLWIATDLGVVRYNGNKFELFNLPDNVIFKIKEDGKGRIWFFNLKAQLAYFEKEKMQLYQYNDSISRNIQTINITDAYIDTAGNMLINSSRGKNFRISNKGVIEAFDYLPLSKTTTSYYEINNMAGNKYFASRINWNGFNNDSIRIKLSDANRNVYYQLALKGDSYNHYGCLYFKDAVYFFCGRSIIRLNKDGTFLIREMPRHILCINTIGNNICVGMIKAGAFLLNSDLTDGNNPEVLPNKSITSIATDYEGGYWFSTLESGVYYIKNINIRHYTTLSGLQVFRLFNKDDEMMLYATAAGLYSFEEGKSELFLDQVNIKIADILSDGSKDLFLATAFEEFTTGKMNTINNRYFNHVYAFNSPHEMCLSNKDSIVVSGIHKVSTLNTGFTKSGSAIAFNDALITAGQRSISFKPSNLFADANRKVWAATIDGLYRMNNSLTDFEKFKPADALLNKGITSVRQMENGLLVAGIRFQGIALISDTNIIANITEKDGLLSNKIKYILPIGDKIWVATARGLSVIHLTSVSPLKYSIANIGKNDGFYNVTINHLIQYRNCIFAATNNGIYCLENSNDFLSRKTQPIYFYVNSINYFGGDTTGINSITVPYQNNRLLIKYSAVCFNSTEEIKYLYRFEKSDTNWHATTSTELLLENLEPGNYNLQIKAAIPGQDRYSDVQSIMIKVGKPLWQNNWIRLLTVLLVAGCIYLYITRRVKKIQAEEKRKTALNAKLSELEQTALRSQMNPHFIFNCLTSIQQLIVSGNQTDANEYLVKFARLIRKTLDLSAHPFISIREETEYLNEYLFLEQLRLSGQFEYNITSSDSINIDKMLIPNMMIQPVVENCIRHGIKSLENNEGLINIQFDHTERAITCTVTDNGVGRTGKSAFNENVFTKHKSYGIDIIRKRLQAFAEFNEQYTGIEIEDLFDKEGQAAGTRVILQLPYKNNV